jgi:hypothetical protein
MKLSFSQRIGIEPVKSVLQVDSMDDDLRNGLWNALTIFYWNQVRGPDLMEFFPKLHTLCKLLWLSYFGELLDTLSIYWHEVYQEIRQYFFNCPWNKVYDFIDFVANNYPDEDNSVNPQFMDFCNRILEKELSAYRFVGGTIAPLTSEQEIAEIEEVLEAKSPKPVTVHLKRALGLLADRESPDYRNSIKESISAVEAICGSIAENPKASLGKALKAIERDGKVDLHPALKAAFDKLYGYTSDADGIRHALLDEPNLDFEDAKFMLVSCSAFINYLRAKSSKAGIKL